MLRRLPSAALLAAATAFAGSAASQTIDGRTYFHPSAMITSGGPQNEGGAPDNGGIIVGIFENTTGSALDTRTLAAFVNGQEADSYNNIPWYRFWPREVPPGGTFSLEIKGMDTPILPGLPADLQVRQGAAVLWSETKTPAAPAVAVGHAVPSIDRSTLFVFVRNDGGDALELEGATVNGESFDAAASAPRGTGLPPGGLSILEVQPSFALDDLVPLHIAVDFVDGDSDPHSALAAIRVTEPFFHTGTWSGAIFQQDDTVLDGRSIMGHSISLSSFNERSIYQRGNGYLVRSTVPDRIDDDLDPAPLIAERDNTGIYGWTVYDEPELRGVSAARASRWNMVYWDESPRQPTLVTNASNRAFQRYGGLVDHPMMDHYAQFAPLVYGGSGTTYSIRNTYAYTKALKRGTEPRRPWVWAQGISTVWGTQPTAWGIEPTAWGIEVQYWNHIAAGTKGILYFQGNPGTLEGFPAQYQRMRDLVVQANHVRELLVFGDAIENATTTASDALAASVVSTDRMVLVVTNASGTYTSSLIGAGSVSISTVATDVSAVLPSWIDGSRVVEVTKDGFAAPASPVSVDGGVLTITGLSLTEAAPTRVFLVGPEDTAPPARPEGLRMANANGLPGGSIPVAWPESRDDVGVVSYIVRDRQGAVIAEVDHPMVLLEDVPADGIHITVTAVDGHGNQSPASEELWAKRWRWVFDNDDHTHRWRFSNAEFKFPVRDGAIELAHLGSNNRIQRDELGIQASPGDVIVVRQRNDTDRTVSRLLWRGPDDSGFAGARSLNATIAAFGEDFVDVAFEVGTVATWTGVIEEIRYLPANNATSGTSFIQSIELNPVEDEGPPTSVGDWLRYD